jgi:hypothetical protein
LSVSVYLLQPCHFPSKYRNILIREICTAVSKEVKSIWMEFQAHILTMAGNWVLGAGWSLELLSDGLLKEPALGYMLLWLALCLECCDCSRHNEGSVCPHKRSYNYRNRS